MSEYTTRTSISYNQHNTTRSHRNEINFKEILQTISQLEQYLIEDHIQDYKLRMTLDKQTENLSDLKICLRNEKQRNKRLINLMLSEDSKSSEDGIDEEYDKVGKGYVNEPFDYISPLLMQQRYEDLSCSYNLCRKQLLKRDQELKIYKCEKELLESKYDKLLIKYKGNQKSLEYNVHLRKLKNYKIHYLQDALNYATNCLLTVQYIIDILTLENKNLRTFKEEFQQNLQLFLNKLLLNEWKYCNCYAIANSK